MGDCAESTKLLLEDEKIDVNAKDVYLFSSVFISINFNFKIIIGIYSNYFGQHLCGHLLEAT